MKDALRSPAWSSRLLAEAPHGRRQTRPTQQQLYGPSRRQRDAPGGCRSLPCPALPGPALRAPSPGFRAVSIALRPARSREAGLPVRQPPPYPQRPLPAPSPLLHLQPPPPPSALLTRLSRQRNHRDNTAPPTALGRRHPPSGFRLRHFRQEVWSRRAGARGASEANSARGSPGGRCRL